MRVWRAMVIAMPVVLCPVAGAQVSVPAAPPIADKALASEVAKPAEPLDTRARTFIRKLPANAANIPTPRRFSSGDYQNPRTAIVLDEIRVYGQIEPEDYVGRKKTPLQQFHEHLERDRPLTPAEKTQLALCFIGLCSIYGPDGAPAELSAADRSEARLQQSTTQLIGQFRGSLQ